MGIDSRTLTVAAAQMGPIPRSQTRAVAVGRLIDLLRQAHARGAELVVFPECALTAFFPHWWIADEAELDSHFETEMPNAAVRPLFDEAARLGVAFNLGYAELAIDAGVKRRFNTSVLVDRKGRIIAKYRKVHLPGHADHRPHTPFQNLEKRYFEPGDGPFAVHDLHGVKTGMLICNDRRWPEAYRALGLQGCELVTLGYNTPRHHPGYSETDRLSDFHHLLSLQAGAYQNGMWVVAAAKAGTEEGVEQIGGSLIVAPSGESVTRSVTLEDEVIVARCHLDMCRTYKEGVFPHRNRRVEHYGLLTR